MYCSQAHVGGQQVRTSRGTTAASSGSPPVVADWNQLAASLPHGRSLEHQTWRIFHTSTRLETWSFRLLRPGHVPFDREAFKIKATDVAYVLLCALVELSCRRITWPKSNQKQPCLLCLLVVCLRYVTGANGTCFRISLETKTGWNWCVSCHESFSTVNTLEVGWSSSVDDKLSLNMVFSCVHGYFVWTCYIVCAFVFVCVCVSI